MLQWGRDGSAGSRIPNSRGRISRRSHNSFAVWAKRRTQDGVVVTHHTRDWQRPGALGQGEPNSICRSAVFIRLLFSRAGKKSKRARGIVFPKEFFGSGKIRGYQKPLCLALLPGCLFRGDRRPSCKSGKDSHEKKRARSDCASPAQPPFMFALAELVKIDAEQARQQF